MKALGEAALIVALFAGGYLAVYLLLKRRLARALSAAAILGEVREEVNRILVELNQTTNRNITRIEDRIRSLNEVLGKADKRLALLARETEKQDLASRLYSELSARRPAPSGEPPVAPAPAAPPAEERERADRNEEVVRLARSGLGPALIARQLGITLGEVELIISLAQRAR